MMVLGDGGFERGLGHGSGALENGISTVTKKTAQSSLAPPPVEDTASRQPSASQGERPQNKGSWSAHLDLRLWPPELQESE